MIVLERNLQPGMTTRAQTIAIAICRDSTLAAAQRLLTNA